EALIAQGAAYEAEGHVLFNVDAYEHYGQLSGRSTEDMIAGARVEVAPYKKNPMDFVLWKPSDAETPGWESPWGRGRPGWHIECSAMSKALLGARFDIHGGGIDLQFPHHENEIAQSKCLCGEESFAQIWMHNEMLQVEGKKMSKSLGNFFTVRDLLDRGIPGEVIRYVFLMTHYSKPMDWTEDKARQAEATLRKWGALTDGIEPSATAASVKDALADDLNTPAAMSALHALAAAGDAAGLKASAQVLGLLTDEHAEWRSTEDTTADLIETLLSARKDARAAKDFARADAIRDAFNAAGVDVMDSPQGTTWSLKPGFDATKLEGIA
ncbi:MAG: class I tRNA ligase family protein, partial [Pseudomonadota bacterium]